MTLTLATVLLILCVALVAWSFSGIVKGYLRRAGIPWLASIVFAAAATAAVFALHILLSH